MIFFSVESIIRIDVWPNGWFNPGYLNVIGKARLNRPSLCDPQYTTVETCFLDPYHGSFNAITTGVIIATGVTRTGVYTSCGRDKPYLWTNSTSYPSNPEILAYIIRKLPWEAECMSNNSHFPPSQASSTTSFSSTTSSSTSSKNLFKLEDLWKSPSYYAGSVGVALVLGLVLGVVVTYKIAKKKFTAKQRTDEDEFLIQ